jgi:hypothetical protein
VSDKSWVAGRSRRTWRQPRCDAADDTNPNLERAQTPNLINCTMLELRPERARGAERFYDRSRNSTFATCF